MAKNGWTSSPRKDTVHSRESERRHNSQTKVAICEGPMIKPRLMTNGSCAIYFPGMYLIMDQCSNHDGIDENDGETSCQLKSPKRISSLHCID